MRLFFLVLIALDLCSCHDNASTPSQNTADTLQKTDTVKIYEIPLLKEVKYQQEYMKTHRIQTILRYSRPLDSKRDTFSLNQIQNYDQAGRLTSILDVNSFNTDTSGIKTFFYRNNGALSRINSKLPNGHTIDEYFYYMNDGRLQSSYLMGRDIPLSDTFHYVYSGDTLYKLQTGGTRLTENPDIQIFNAKHLVVKTIERTPFKETVQKTYTDSCPIPQREFYSAGGINEERKFEFRYY